MKKNRWKKGLAAILGVILAIHSPLGTCLSANSVYAYTERSATINASSLNVRSAPGTSYSSQTKLARGAAVTVVNETTGSDGRLWYQIRYTGSGGTATGYVLSTYISFPASYTPSADFEAELTAQGFPDSYKDALRQLHAKYPNWIFEAQQTGLDWNTVIENESVLGRNLVANSSISSYKSLVDGAYDWDNGTWTGFDGSTWVAASQEIISYYMDPRNFLDEVSVFQFLNHKYDSSVQTREGLAQMIKGTFLEGSVIYQGSGAGTTDSSTGNTSGNTSGGGPGVSSGGPGASGDSSSSSGSSNVIVSPSGGKGGRATLTSPSASISPHKTSLVTSSAEVVVGNAPGSDGGQTGGTQTSPGTSGTVSSPNSSGGSSVITAPQTSASPTVSAPSGGTTTDSGTSQTPGTLGETQTESSYVDIIMNAAQQTGLNPYVIASMIIQEQGKNGQGRSISGTVSGYTGYYNYFNVGAYAENGMTAVERGLWYASQSGDYGRPWNTPEKAIIGGAQFYSTNYVSNGQDTFYLKKYNVQGSNLYKHQYMTNVDGAASEASLFAEGYAQYIKDLPLRFKIPVFNNMPETPCAKPTGSGSPNNKLSSLGVEGFTLTPTFNRDTYSYDLIVDPSVDSVTVSAGAIDSKASLSGTGTVSLQSGANEIRVVVTAENGTQREYVIHVVRQNNGPTYSAGTGVSDSGTVSGGSNGTTSGVVGPGVSSGGPGSSGTDSGNTSDGAPTPGGSNVIVISPAG